MARYDFCFAALMAGVALAGFGLEVVQAAPIAAEQEHLPFPPARIVRVGDRLNLPMSPPTPGTATRRERVSPEQAGAAVAASIQARFTQATGSPDSLLTRQAALASGWGWAADHFAEIDRQNKGKVSLNDVLDYVNRRSSLTVPRVRADGA